MLKEKIYHWFTQLQQLTKARRWRSLVVLVGDDEWTAQQLETSLPLFLSAQDANARLVPSGLAYGDVTFAGTEQSLISVNRKTYTQYLGTEQSIILFAVENSTPGFEIDAFAALAGTLVAGGVFILVLSRGQQEQLKQVESHDYFMQRFLGLLATKDCYVIKQGNTELPALLALQSENMARENNLELKSTTSIPSLPYGCVTEEQVLAVDAMLKVLSGHRNRPLVMTADRGRGKSTALALAACDMLKNAQQPLEIIITAASKQALNIFFQQVEKHLPDAKLSATSIEHINGRIIFYPIDTMLKECPKASIVMVDEAAAFPVYLLQQLLSQYHRLIFATTIHGYEGAGRGFSIKFRQVLQHMMPNFRDMHIHQPIRWASDDPLEAFVFSSCLLNANLPRYDNHFLTHKTTSITDDNAKVPSTLFEQKVFSVQLVSAKELLRNEALLQQVFAVLVTAHYQTSPSDVQLLLNNKAISLFVIKHQNDILGVAMLMREGQADNHLVELVQANHRRLRDQFLPQSLLTHCGIKESFNYSYQRVMRIAIHPQWQGQGLGSYFLKTIEQQIAVQNCDVIGASFAGNALLLKYWQQAGFTVARVGFSKDKASGEHSCVVIKALTSKANKLQQVSTMQFFQQFDYWLTDEFKYLPATLVWQLLHGNTLLKALTLSRDVLSSVNDFISGQRQFSSCVYALHQWLLTQCTDRFEPEVLPLLARILQKQTIEQVCQQYGFTGKKALNQHLINYISAHQKG